MITKKCSKCGEEKSINEFCRDKNGKFGVRSLCKVCERKYQRERYKVPEVRARCLKNMKKCYDKNKNSKVDRINKIVEDFIKDGDLI